MNTDKVSAGVALIPISFGELADKLSILVIKNERIKDEVKLLNVRKELAQLSQLKDSHGLAGPQFEQLYAALKTVNEALWETEDDIRECERRKEFGARFIELARSIYRTNDQRARLKGDINALFKSAFAEVKSYADY